MYNAHARGRASGSDNYNDIDNAHKTCMYVSFSTHVRVRMRASTRAQSHRCACSLTPTHVHPLNTFTYTINTRTQLIVTLSQTVFQ